MDGLLWKCSRISRMRFHMKYHFTMLPQTTAANTTSERQLTGMEPFVNVQRSLLLKNLLTHIATEWFPDMVMFVFVQ